MGRLLDTFLGKERFKALGSALSTQWKELASPSIPLTVGISAVLIGVLPALVSYLPRTFDLDIKTIATGIAVLLSIALRVRYKVQYVVSHKLKTSLSLTHTAFAIGCIPFVLILLIAPSESYTFPLDSVSEEGEPPGIETIVIFILLVSLWAAVTEEWIYRGLIVGVLRRIPLLKSQRSRDLFAVSISAALFSIAHFGTWGIALTLGLFGVGFGFGIAYIATGERLVPLMIYHALFDILSLSVAFFRS